MFYSWDEERRIFPDGIITQDIVQVWVQIRNFKDVVVNYVYRELAQHALTCRIIPVSNAVCGEYVFLCFKYQKQN